MTIEEKARHLFSGDYNCSQGVFAAFAADLKADEKTLLSVSKGFGGGIGGRRDGICGAVSGGILALGFHKDFPTPMSPTEKKAFNSMIQSFIHDFEAEKGDHICQQLLDIHENRVDGEAKKCMHLVTFAATLTQGYLDKTYPN